MSLEEQYPQEPYQDLNTASEEAAGDGGPSPIMLPVLQPPGQVDETSMPAAMSDDEIQQAEDDRELYGDQDDEDYLFGLDDPMVDIGEGADQSSIDYIVDGDPATDEFLFGIDSPMIDVEEVSPMMAQPQQQPAQTKVRYGVAQKSGRRSSGFDVDSGVSTFNRL
jgi:hypothetical protein